MKSAEVLNTIEEKFPQIQPSTKLDEAQSIVKKNMYWAMGLGIIPVPVLDVLAVGGFQAKAIKELSDLYEIPFYDHKVKNVIAVLLGGLSTPIFAGALLGTVVKIIPGLGSLAGIAAMPIMAGAITYALGQVFIQHFESGGTFLNFDPQSVKDYFNEKIKEGLTVAEETPAPAEAAPAKKATN